MRLSPPVGNFNLVLDVASRGYVMLSNVMHKVLPIMATKGELEYLFAVVRSNTPAKWNALRSMHEILDRLPYDPYPVDWTLIFTPIEKYTWNAIRHTGLKFRPQYPVGKFFADFADPWKKIVIECDGKQFHQDKERDQQRDNLMKQDGWRVFRITGSACNRNLESPAELGERYQEYFLDDEQSRHEVRQWYLQTVDGLIAAISAKYYDGIPAPQISGNVSDNLVDEVLLYWSV